MRGDSKGAHMISGTSVYLRVHVSLLLASLLFATPAAADGVIEINQAKALAGGVTPGDIAGFPVTISQAGSYRLTSNLDRSGVALSTHAIAITAADVTLDLAGFAILGAAVCSGFPVSACTNTGTGDGIASFNVENVTVRNGSVRGMPRSGVRITGQHSVVERVRALSNGMHGIEVLEGLVVDCEGTQNFGDGISSYGTVQRSLVYANRSDGIAVASGHVVSCKATSNGGFGLQTFNTPSAYGLNMFICNNNAGQCSDGVQVSHPLTAVQIGLNQCGWDTNCD